MKNNKKGSPSSSVDGPDLTDEDLDFNEGSRDTIINYSTEKFHRSPDFSQDFQSEVTSSVVRKAPIVINHSEFLKRRPEGDLTTIDRSIFESRTSFEMALESLVHHLKLHPRSGKTCKEKFLKPIDFKVTNLPPEEFVVNFSEFVTCFLPQNLGWLNTELESGNAKALAHVSKQIL